MHILDNFVCGQKDGGREGQRIGRKFSKEFSIQNKRQAEEVQVKELDSVSSLKILK